MKSPYTVLPLLFMLVLPTFSFAQTASDSNESTTTRQQNVRGWRGQSSDLQQKISALPSVAANSVFMPVLFGVGLNNISPNFGDPRSGGRTHEGEDIMAKQWTPIVSPTAAVVLRTGVGATEGNYVYTANPGGETFVYMHLVKIGEGVVSGATLEQGSLIGYVGATGNAQPGSYHLHFEIHNPSGTPMDPFPRLTAEFSVEQKISFLNTIFTQSADPVALSELLVTNFRSYFVADAQSGITLPPLITGALDTVPVATAATPVSTLTLPPGDLELGSSGSAVSSLQTFLINKAIGPAATRLAQAGATGNFGSITEAALVEYQSNVGITPANGYYGPATRALVTVNATTAPTAPVSTPVISDNTTSTITRNLFYGISGQDVLALQKFLNVHGFTVASSGSGSLGNETIYFGAATQAAVIRFQIAHSITPAVGYVGVLTRAALAV